MNSSWALFFFFASYLTILITFNYISVMFNIYVSCSVFIYSWICFFQ
ncbi:putative membrane protein [Escherichia coli DEC8B]|nr:putative membrane protein [Escherichia coli DEC8B]